MIQGQIRQYRKFNVKDIYFINLLLSYYEHNSKKSSDTAVNQFSIHSFSFSIKIIRFEEDEIKRIAELRRREKEEDKLARYQFHSIRFNAEQLYCENIETCLCNKQKCSSIYF